jgi:hypothetical protein
LHCRRNSVHHVIYPGVSFRRPVRCWTLSASLLLYPFPTLSVRRVFVPCAAFSPYHLIFSCTHAATTFVVISHRYTDSLSASCSLAFPAFPNLETLSLRAAFLVWCDRGFRSFHICTCLPARGRDSGECLLACRRAFGLRRAADVDPRLCRLPRFSQYPVGCIDFSRVG